MVMGRGDEGTDGVAAERGEVHAECASVLPHDLDPVGPLGLARPHPRRRIVRTTHRLYRHAVLRAVPAGRGREHAGGEEVGLVAAGQLVAGRALRGSETRIGELIEHRRDSEAHGVVERAAVRVHVAIDQPGHQRAPAAVYAQEILRQVEAFPDAPDAAVLDPHVLFGPERLSVEGLHSKDREADLGLGIVPRRGARRLGQRHKDAHEHGEHGRQVRDATRHGSSRSSHSRPLSLTGAAEPDGRDDQKDDREDTDHQHVHRSRPALVQSDHFQCEL